MKKIDHYENLSRLYLRLNGFISSNFIIHSAKEGNNLGELDHIGYRMPLHSQEDRKVKSSEYLDLPNNRIQVIIGDTKSGVNPKKIRFNDGLRKNDESILKLCHWLGIFDKITSELIKEIQFFLNVKLSDRKAGFPQINVDSSFGLFSIRFILLCPNLEKADSDTLKYIHGAEMINYCWRCLNKTEKIGTCSRAYSLKHWHELEKYVNYFKSIESPRTIREFIDAMEK